MQPAPLAQEACIAFAIRKHIMRKPAHDVPITNAY